jgi:hypothetical protein
MTVIRPCSCHHEYQDKKQNRVKNQIKTASNPAYRP